MQDFVCRSYTLMHQSFVTTAPHLRGRVGDSRAKVWGNYYLIVMAVQGNDRVLTLGSCWEIFYCEGQNKEQRFDFQFLSGGKS